MHSLAVQEDYSRFRKLKIYLRKLRINKTLANEQTNNGAEIYHAKLTAEIVASQFRILYLIQILNDIITDTHLDVEPLSNGVKISRTRKRKNIDNDMLVSQCKHKLEGDTHRNNICLHWVVQLSWIIQVNK